MKRAVLILLMLFPIALHARSLKTGGGSVTLTVGAVDGIRILENFSGELHFASLVKPRLELGGSISGIYTLIHQGEYDVPVFDITGAFTFSHILISAKRTTLALWGEASAEAGYETVNWGNSILPDGAVLKDENRFICGIGAALRLEIPLSPRTGLLVRVKEHYMPQGISQFHTEMSVGITINL